MRPRARRLTLVATVALVAGCGSDAASSNSAGMPVTKSEAVAFAQAVNLLPSDLPGAVTEHAPGASEPQSSLSKVIRCARPGRVSQPVGEESSAVFAGHNLFAVVSLVRVMPSEGVAAEELAALASKRGHVCFANAAKIEGGEPHGQTPPIKATFVPLVKLLGTGAIGVHTVSRLPHTAASELFYTGIVLFRVGPSEITLITVASKRFPTATEGRLLALLYSRAEAHKL